MILPQVQSSPASPQQLRPGEKGAVIARLLAAGKAEEAGQYFEKWDMPSRQKRSRLLAAGLSETVINALESLGSDQTDPAKRWQQLGELQLGAGRYPDAEHCFTTALRFAPRSAPLIVLHADTLRGLTRIDEALSRYDAAITLEHDLARAHNGRGLALQMAGRFDAAIEAHKKALVLEPDNPDVLLELGNALKAKNRMGDAFAIYTRALNARPEFAEALNNRGATLQALDRHREAVADFDRAIKISPRHLFAHLNYGVSLCALGELQAGASAFAVALSIDPTLADCHHNLGIALLRLEQYQAAINNFDATLVLDPSRTGSVLSKGNSLRELGLYEEAIATYQHALKIDPTFVDARINMADALQELARHKEAIMVLDEALKQRPDYSEGQWNKANSMLCFGPSEAAWKAYDHRHRLTSGSKLPDLGLPLLGDESPAGRKLLIQWEQRFGDIIQMLRYVPDVENLAGSCYWQVAEPLHRLVKASFPEISVVGLNESPEGLNARLPYTSLPLALRTFDLAAIPANVPYLKPSATAKTRWRPVLTGLERSVGIIWRGNPRPRGRSIPLEELKPLLDLDDVRFVSLQAGATEAERKILERYKVLDIGGGLDTFDDTAAVLTEVDLVISIDTAACHLAGALARPTWVMLKYGADWRWLLSRTDSPWYPTAKLFRQDEPGNWAPVVSRIASEFETWLKTQS